MRAPLHSLPTGTRFRTSSGRVYVLKAVDECDATVEPVRARRVKRFRRSDGTEVEFNGRDRRRVEHWSRSTLVEPIERGVS